MVKDDKMTAQQRPHYKNKRVMLLSNGHIIEARYPLDNTLINRGKAILVLDDAEDNA